MSVEASNETEVLNKNIEYVANSTGDKNSAFNSSKRVRNL